MPMYSTSELKRKLGEAGWRTNIGNSSFRVEGTLGEMVEGAYGRRKNGQSMGIIEEAESKFKLDLLQLKELWQHMGLPTT